MRRKIVKIDEDKCDGCWQCVPACREGAIQVIDGKARLVSDVYCDGLGDCIGQCPRGAITIEEREAEAFDPAAVEEHEADEPAAEAPRTSGCPGSAVRQLQPAAAGDCPGAAMQRPGPKPGAPEPAGPAGPPQLANWPVQLALVPPDAPCFKDAELLVSADCVPFALADFHNRLLAGKALVIACPKLDGRMDAYVEKLEAVFRNNNIASVTVAHMEVPCCTGIVHAARTALERSGKTDIEFHDVTVGIDGKIKRES